MHQHTYAQVNPPVITAIYNSKNHSVDLEWKMASVERKTAFIILKSTDGIHWKELIRDQLFKMYTNEDYYTYTDDHIKFTTSLYRLRIIDEYKNTIAFSVAVSAGNDKSNPRATLPVNIPSRTSGKKTVTTDTTDTEDNKGDKKSRSINHSLATGKTNTWRIYPNPVADVLNMKYEGSSPIKGAINVTVLDMRGNMQKRFRCASTCRSIQIPVENLSHGVYIVQLMVSNEMLINQRFVKQ